MPSDAPARCEPPEALRGGYGYHYINLVGRLVETGADHTVIRLWVPSLQYWTGPGGHMDPRTAFSEGYRYLSPVPTPSEIATLVRAGRAVVQFVAHYPELKTPATDALSAALAAPSFKEIGDE